MSHPTTSRKMTARLQPKAVWAYAVIGGSNRNAHEQGIG
jgi:hypothetical protein